MSRVFLLFKIYNSQLITGNKTFHAPCPQLLEFANEHSAELGTATRAVQQSAEQAEANIKWLSKNHETINNWLKRATA